MANLVASDLTVTIPLNKVRIAGRRRATIGTVSFGDGQKLYPSGGIAITPQAFGMVRELDSVVFADPGSRGILWTYDITNAKIRGYVSVKDTPALAVEDMCISLGGKVWKPSYLPAYILSLYGSDSALYDVIPSSATASAAQASVNFSTGLIAMGANLTTVKATYVPKDDTGFFSAGNMVVEESTVVAAASVTLGYAAALIQNVYDSTTGSILTIVGDDQTPSSDQVKIGTESGTAGITTLTFNSAQNGDTVVITYLRYAGLDISTFPYIAKATISLTSEAINFLGTTGYKGLVLPTLGTRVVGTEAGGTVHSVRLGGPSVTAASGKAKWNPELNKITTAESAALTALRMPLLLYDADFRNNQSTRELHPVEAPSSSTMNFMATGW